MHLGIVRQTIANIEYNPTQLVTISTNLEINKTQLELLQKSIYLKTNLTKTTQQ